MKLQKKYKVLYFSMELLSVFKPFPFIYTCVCGYVCSCVGSCMPFEVED